MMNENTSMLLVVAGVAGGLLGIILWILILWAIIRAGVLSALRAHTRETRRAAGLVTRPNPIVNDPQS